MDTVTAFVILDRDWNDYWQEQLSQWDAREYEGGFDPRGELAHWLREGFAFDSREAAEAEAVGRGGHWRVHEVDVGDVAALISRFVLGESQGTANLRADAARRSRGVETRLVSVRLPVELVERIDAVGGSRSAWIEEAVRARLARG